MYNQYIIKCIGCACALQGDKAAKHNTFSLFVSPAGPDTIEGLFIDLRDQAFKMDMADLDEAVKVSVDSTFMKEYSRRRRKGGLSDRGARVGKADRRNYELGWRAHTVQLVLTLFFFNLSYTKYISSFLRRLFPASFINKIANITLLSSEKWKSP